MLRGRPDVQTVSAWQVVITGMMLVSGGPNMWGSGDIKEFNICDTMNVCGSRIIVSED